MTRKSNDVISHNLSSSTSWRILHSTTWYGFQFIWLVYSHFISQPDFNQPSWTSGGGVIPRITSLRWGNTRQIDSCWCNIGLLRSCPEECLCWNIAWDKLSNAMEVQKCQQDHHQCYSLCCTRNHNWSTVGEAMLSVPNFQDHWWSFVEDVVLTSKFCLQKIQRFQWKIKSNQISKNFKIKSKFNFVSSFFTFVFTFIYVPHSSGLFDQV